MTARRSTHTANPKFKTAEDCPRPELHTSDPTGYVAWHVWAERMDKTHVQHRCPSCGFLAVWVPK